MAVGIMVASLVAPASSYTEIRQGLLRVADLEDSALAGERDTLLGHLRLEVVNAEHAELVVGHGRLEVFGDAIERFA
jgi:hypothetical protein